MKYGRHMPLKQVCFQSKLMLFESVVNQNIITAFEVKGIEKAKQKT